MTHTTLPYATTLLPPGIFGPPGEKQSGRDWSSVETSVPVPCRWWKMLLEEPGQGHQALPASSRMLSLRPWPDCHTHTREGLLLFQTAALACNTQVPPQLQSKPGCDRNWESQQSPQTTGLPKPRRITSCPSGLMEVQRKHSAVNLQEPLKKARSPASSTVG